MLIDTVDKNHNNNNDCQDCNEAKNDKDYAWHEEKMEGCPEEAPKVMQSSYSAGYCFKIKGNLECKYSGMQVCAWKNKNEQLRCDGDARLKEVVFRCDYSGLDKKWEIISGHEHLEG